MTEVVLAGEEPCVGAGVFDGGDEEEDAGECQSTGGEDVLPAKTALALERFGTVGHPAGGCRLG